MAGFDPPIARTYSSTECENSALTIQATTAGLKELCSDSKSRCAHLLWQSSWHTPYYIYKIKLLSTSCKQDKLTALFTWKFGYFNIWPSSFVKLRTGWQGKAEPFQANKQSTLCCISLKWFSFSLPTRIYYVLGLKAFLENNFPFIEWSLFWKHFVVTCSSLLADLNTGLVQ